MSTIRDDNDRIALQLSPLLKACFALLILLELIGPFVNNSYGPDGGFHLYWIEQFITLNAGGILFPRWIPDGFWGFGSAAFYFYPPLTYYLASFIHTVSGITAPTMLFQICSLLATVGSFFTARKLLQSMGAEGAQVWIGSALYAFAPYRIAEIYSLSSLSSHVAFVFFPLVWCGLIEIFRAPGMKGMLLLSISFALMSLSNIPVTALTLVTMIVAAVVFRNELSVKKGVVIAASLCLAAMLVSFYLTSILANAPYVQLGYLSTQREFFLDDLLHLRNLPGLYHLALLYAAMIAIVLACVHVYLTKEQISTEERALLRMGLGMIALLLILEIPAIGRPVLSTVPMINLVQGTWRFYVDIVLLASCLIGVARSESLRKAAKQIMWVWVTGAMLAMALIVLHVHLSTHQKTRASDPPEYVPIYTLKNHDTLEAVFSNLKNMDPIVRTSGGGANSISLRNNDPEREEYTVNFETETTVTFHRFFWPAWHLYASDREIPSCPDSIGRAIAVLPVGRYNAEWRLERTPLECAGFWISGIAWAGMIMFWGIGIVRMRVKKKQTISP